MNNETGELLEFREAQSIAMQRGRPLEEMFTGVEEEDMTAKQKETKQVSLKDHRSKLGKKLTSVRRRRKIGRNEACPCGSGLKYKKCCLKPS
jgi:uncharacterized protein YecA (UPF0149 family)